MQIPIESLTTRHDVRFDRSEGWRRVVNITPKTGTIQVEVETESGVACTVLYAVGRSTKVNARLQPHHFSAPAVEVRAGRSAEDQESSFGNATLQGSEAVAYSVATHVSLPPHLVDDEAGAAEYLGSLLGWLAEVARQEGNDVSFEVEVGPDQTPEGDDDDDEEGDDS